MKIKINIDCTPKEARSFFGLPDFEEFQADLMKAAQEKLQKGLSSEDWDALMKTWAGGAGAGWTEFQKSFFAAAGASKSKA